MSGPKCATVAPASVSYQRYRAAQEEARRQERARKEQERAVREREAQARKARERQQRECRMLAESRSRVDALQQDYARLQKRVDDARNRLPDFCCVLDELPAAPDSERLVAWQSHAVALEAQMHAWRSSAEKAIAHAEYLQRRRERTREAWAQYQTLRDQCGQLLNDLRELADALGEPERSDFNARMSLPTGTECEAVESENEILRQDMQHLKDRIALCSDTVKANTALRGLLNRLVQRQAMVSDAEALAAWKTSDQAMRLQEFEEQMQRHLSQFDLSESELPVSLQNLLADIRLGQYCAEGVDFWARTAGFAQKRRQRAHAANLLSAVPFMEDADLLRRWQGICHQLDQVANGLVDFTPTLQRAYDDLKRVAEERMGQRYTRLAVQMALRESGFVAVERDDIQFEDSQGETMLLGLPGYQEHRVLLRMEGGQLHWIPFRTNDAVDRGAKVRDHEFDKAACSKLRGAADGLNSGQGAVIGEIAALADPDEHPVLLASEMTELGVLVGQRAARVVDLKQASRDTGT